ncbi:hypothetical protein F6X40_35705 [Paraburkholderia sp. UCT31]|uniref:hypothetical protein n=1 Tax=Paraburkholderia sp. UCT31 TaxID=2615209 RepID=UPI001655E5DB|nr:hypothetical protein [Paraburkholderia sp. UCT31]MBC8741897.1 hypothetical protein [Paraburkholderia sp. UCT31]
MNSMNLRFALCNHGDFNTVLLKVENVPVLQTEQATKAFQLLKDAMVHHSILAEAREVKRESETGRITDISWELGYMAAPLVLSFARRVLRSSGIPFNESDYRTELQAA